MSKKVKPQALSKFSQKNVNKNDLIVESDDIIFLIF